MQSALGIHVLDSLHVMVSEWFLTDADMSVSPSGALEACWDAGLRCASRRVAGPQAWWPRLHTGTPCGVVQV